MEQALDVALDKKDPKRKLERRKARQQRRENATKAAPRPDEVSEDVVPGVEDEPARSRYVPSEAIERVHARGNNQCEYKSDDGRRCRSRTGLQVDHERPFAIFRSHDERFLRLLCPPIIAWRPNMSTGRNSSSGRSMKGGGVGKCRSADHRLLELHRGSLAAQAPTWRRWWSIDWRS